MKVSANLKVAKTTSQQKQRALKSTSRDNDAFGFDNDSANDLIRTVHATVTVS